jgi:two-component system, OmpR family, heavy metal sensor histidine kinase CusS
VQNLSQRLEVPKAKDELRRLTVTLNDMLERIESSVKRIRQFTANASHDLRTPLSLIRTHAELALRRTRSEAEYRQALSHILAASEETTRLIESLLALARTDAGETQLKIRQLDLTPVLQKSAPQASVLANSKGLSFSSSLSHEPMFLLADSAAIETLLLAILDNAVKYTPAGGFVRLRSFTDSGHAVIEVVDSGVGIAPEDLPRIFDRFFRADQARSREVPGSGLGLAIALWLAEAHKGRIEVESEPACGSLFRILLPLVSAVPSVAPHAAELHNSPAVVP